MGTSGAGARLPVVGVARVRRGWLARAARRRLLSNPQMQLSGAWAPQPPRDIFGSLGRGGRGRPPQLICMSLGGRRPLVKMNNCLIVGLRDSSGSKSRPTSRRWAGLRHEQIARLAARPAYHSRAAPPVSSGARTVPCGSTGLAPCSAAGWVPGVRQLPEVKSSYARSALCFWMRGSPPGLVFAPAI